MVLLFMLCVPTLIPIWKASRSRVSTIQYSPEYSHHYILSHITLNLGTISSSLLNPQYNSVQDINSSININMITNISKNTLSQENCGFCGTENWVPGPNGTTQCYGTLLIPVSCYSGVLLTLYGRRPWFDVTKSQK